MIGEEGCHGVGGAVGDDVRHRRLKRGAEIGDVLIGQGCRGLGGEAERRLQAGEREVGARPVDQRARQRDAGGTRRTGGCFHRRAAGIGEAEELGGLVECLAEGVVDGGAERR